MYCLQACDQAVSPPVQDAAYVFIHVLYLPEMQVKRKKTMGELSACSSVTGRWQLLNTGG